MDGLCDLISALSGKDTVVGCRALTLLEIKSDQSDEVYSYFNSLVALLNHKNSYARNRGLTLLADNAKWDTERKIDGILDQILAHITDEKPITSRQCIKILPKLAKDKPELKERICTALKTADTSQYNDSMRPLIDKDIQWALQAISFDGLNGLSSDI